MYLNEQTTKIMTNLIMSNRVSISHQTFKQILLTLTLVLFIPFQCINAQEFIFNDNNLYGWTPARVDHAFNENSLVLTTKANKTTPRILHFNANVNATLNKYATIKMRVGEGGPTLLRLNFNGGTQYAPITNGTSFITYTFYVVDNKWTGTVDEVEFLFYDDDGSGGELGHTSDGVNIEIQEIKFVEFISTDLTELYVDLSNGSDFNSGDYNNPLLTIPYALNLAASNNITNVYIKSGDYTLTEGVNITTVASVPVVLSPEPNGVVSLTLKDRVNFNFHSGAKNIQITGFKLYGESNYLDHWDLVSKYFWQRNDLSDAIRGGGICFRITDAEDIVFSNNIIHDFYQKAFNIENGRYIKIKGNIIYNIGNQSFSGGHGIMRQHGSGSFADSDDPTKYRWDIDGNLIFNVYQKIYSWLRVKGFVVMALDEGHPILIDETPNHDSSMKARIRNNLIAFPRNDAIRLKATNGLEVLNNTIYSIESHAQGITSTITGFDDSTFDEPFLNFSVFNNAVEVISSIQRAYNLDYAVNSLGATFGNNYGAIGKISPTSVANYVESSLFTNPNDGDFTLLNDQLNNVGVDPTILSELNSLAAKYNISIVNDPWKHDPLKTTQTLLDNVPGIEDGIPDNEPVFTNAGVYDASDVHYTKGRKAYYFDINPSWQDQYINDVSNLNRGNGLDQYDGMYLVQVPEGYSDWYDAVKLNYLQDTNGDGVGETAYERIRYGASIITQNKIFQNNSLHVVELESNLDFTTTTANEFDVSLDGDILLKFNYLPNGDESFDLIKAKNIFGSFDKIIVEGYSGEYYLNVVSENNTQVLRLTFSSDTDDDNDGTPDTEDPDESVDTDGDGIGNNTDTDDDVFTEGINTGVQNVIENPQRYNLFTEQDINSILERERSFYKLKGRKEGEDAVLQNPALYGLKSLDYAGKASPYTLEWFYEKNLGWVYTNNSIFPYFFKSKKANEPSAWLYFDNGSYPPRFYNYNTEEWFELKE